MDENSFPLPPEKSSVFEAKQAGLRIVAELSFNTPCFQGLSSKLALA